MKPPQDDQIDQVQQAIAELEARRASLGDEIIETSLAPLRARLEELLLQRQAAEAPAPAAEEQRKLVSVLCADLAGFTELSARLDPEELREVQQAYFAAVSSPIRERGGLVEKYIGDAVLAVFGLPQAHEDDPERAVRAALEMQEALELLNASRKGETGFPLQMRVGLSTGMVLATIKPGTDNFVVTGKAVNLASRLQGLAEAGGVLIPHATYRHLRGVFDVQALEPVTVKGLAEVVAAYRVLRLRPRAFRQVVRGVEGIETPLVGRDEQLKTLQEALLGAVEEREGQVVTIRGDAGVGKSRLLYEFQNWLELRPEGIRFFQGKARQEGQRLPYGLLRDLVAFRFEILDDDPGDAVRRKLEAGFGEVFGAGEDAQMRAHFLGQLLGYDFSTSPHLKAVLHDAEQLRNRGLMYMVEYFKGLCERTPVVVFLEDLHWADDSSLDSINRLGELAPHQPLLVVGAARRTLLERRPYWGEGLGYHHFIELEPLSRRKSRQLVGEILKPVEEIPSQLRELLVEVGEGNPFFIEELVKMLVESGVIVKGEARWRVEAERLEQLTVPATLAGVLQARLDSLPAEERVVLQQASVVGRLFWDRVVAYIHAAEAGERGAEVVPQALSALRGRELVYRREESAFADSREYLFKHDLLREVTYESVLKRLRKAYHALAADWLIEHSGERIGEYRGLIAEHLLLGGQKEGALEYLQVAGEAALATYANTEAEVYFRQALGLAPGEVQQADLLAGLAEALRRQAKHEEGIQIFRKGIDLYQNLGAQDRVAYLYARLSLLLWYVDHPQSWQVCQEGLQRLEGAPDSPGLARLLAEAGRIALFRAEPPEKVETLCQQAFSMAEKMADVEVQVDALVTLGLQSKNISEAVQLMQQAVVRAESLGPCNAVARAHINLSVVYGVYLLDLHASLRELMKAVEITRQTGDIDSMLFVLGVIVACQAEMGNLNLVLESLVNFAQPSAVPQIRVDEFVRLGSSDLFYYRGEWRHALEYSHTRLIELRKLGNLDEFAVENLHLSRSLLDLKGFTGQGDLSEAETALLENIEVGFYPSESQFLLSIVSARRGHLAEAHARLVEALRIISQPENNSEKANRLEAEAELALAEGHLDQAVSAFLVRVELWRAGGYRWKWARELILLGDAYRQRGEPGDLPRARELFQQSLDMFTEMGAPGYTEVLEKDLQNLE